ncbi:MAG: hypothetical protein V4580_09940 [Bacteroidota bacterium]
MGRKLNNILLGALVMFGTSCFSQEDDTKPPKVNNYKSDSSFINFDNLRFTVARAQITLLKDSGALLVRLKTNANTIKRLKAAGNIDLATQVERETLINNKVMMRAYRNEFTFCPVYFFTSDYSDSVKHNNLSGIFVDSNIVVDQGIVCKSAFYLIAEQGSIYESSIGFVTQEQAVKAVERGASSKEVSIVLKNRYFIQLHKPFPYFQQGYSIKKFADHVKKFNANLLEFYKKNTPYTIPPEVMPFVY